MAKALKRLRRRPSGRARVTVSQFREQADGESRGADGKRSSAARGYGGRWRKARATVLQREPLCIPSMKLDGIARPAEVLDHLYPHCGLSWLFWERRLWLPCRKLWHDRDKQAIEARGEIAIDDLADRLGYPTLASLHPDKADEWRAALRGGI